MVYVSTLTQVDDEAPEPVEASVEDEDPTKDRLVRAAKPKGKAKAKAK